MKPDLRIAEMQRRIQAWLRNRTPGEVAGTLDQLNEDITALETELRTLFSHGKSTQTVSESLHEQAVLRTVLESMVEGVVVADMEGHFIIFNLAARKLMGEHPVAIDPKDWSDAYGVFRADGQTPFPSSELPLRRALAGELVDGEELIVRTSAQPADVHLRLTARPLFGGSQQQIGAVVVFHDITESKAVEKELLRARESAENSSRVKSEFLANMSHEIRTPLTAVLGFADLLLDPHLNESDKLDYIQAVRRNGEHLLALINDVLDLSKIQAGKMHVERLECPLPQLLSEVGSVMQVRAHEKGLGFDIVYETPIPASIESDPMRVRQVLLNLLDNAIKFTTQGRVTLTARCAGIGTNASRVELAVSDTGIGLSAGEVDQLFQPFQQAQHSTTREYGGTGLGLAICRSLAEALGGEILVDSTSGEGSTFTLVLYLPVDEATVMVREHGDGVDGLQAQAAQAGPSFQTLTGRVLLVEDGLDNQLLVSTILRRQGLEVDIAADGEAAVARGMEALQAGAPYDLILMDIQMPKLDGYGATAKLRRKGYAGPIVALTAHAMDGERERCIAAGCDDYLTKPIAREVLLAAVESYVQQRLPGGSPGVAAGKAGEGKDFESSELLYSSYSDDPEMDGLIGTFVERLPKQLEDIDAAAEQGEFERLRHLAHQLKGAAGGYGFLPVSAQAAALEAAARVATDVAQVRDAVQRLAAMCARVCGVRRAGCRS